MPTLPTMPTLPIDHQGVNQRLNQRLNRRVKLRDLDTLMAVVAHGGMRKAASQLSLSQPAVSKAVAELEDALGVTLLERNRQGTQVTAAGSALIKRAQAMFDELQLGLRELAHLSDPESGDIRLACSEPVMGGLMAEAIGRMQRRFPRVNFIAESASTGTLQLQMLRDRHSDFIITRPNPLELAPDILAEPLFHDRVGLVVGAGHPLARRRKLTLAELADEPWILSPVEMRADSPVVAGFTALGLPMPRCWLTSGSLNARFALLAGGCHVTAMPGAFLHFAGRHHDIKVLPVALPRWPAPTVLMTLRHHAPSPVVQAFLAILRELARPLAGD